MPQLQPIEQFEFGGTDSRSNPLNMPPNRAIYMRNWAPRADGHLELRYGYSTVGMSVVAASAIHSLIPYQSWDSSKKYLIFAQGTAVKILDLSGTTVSTPAVSGAAIASGNAWGYYSANNRIHLGNGTDQKFYDGIKLRDNGLRAPTTSEISGVIVVGGLGEFTAGNIAGVTLTENAGGNFTQSISGGGYLVYVSYFRPDNSEVGPATINVGSRFLITGATGRKIDLTGLPVTTAGFRKLISRTIDGGNLAYFQYDDEHAISSCVRSGTILTVTCVGHLRTTNDAIILNGTGFDGVYACTVLDGDHFTVNLAAASGANTTGGLMRHILQTDAATTTSSITDINKIDTTYLANQDQGVPAAVAQYQPGYQFYAAIYNPVTGHVGNAILIGGRFAPGNRDHVQFFGLPDYSAIDPEWQLLIGRTGDGALVPYVVIDNGGNFVAVPSGQTSFLMTAAGVDENYEMPTRNGIIPAQCTMFARVGTRSYAADPNSPTVRASADEADAAQGKFLGRPEQSWAGDDIDTFPTAESITGIAEVDYELFVGTHNDTAIFTDMNGQFVWRGPWNVGLAGPRAMTKAMPYGFFWVSGDKQLCTFQGGIPTPVSDEYQRAELSRIGDAYLGTTEVRYYRDVSISKDELRIECRDASGNPFTVIHDFTLTDSRSVTGQGYSAAFLAALATSFTCCEGRDASGRRRVYAGASNGRIYQLYFDGSDAGSEFAADGIFLINTGLKRPDVPNFDWIGDENVVISVGRNLSVALSGGENAFDDLSGTTAQVQEEENDPRYRVQNNVPEMKSHCYLRFQLTSHSADGNLAFNSPPHIPLEAYGKIYEVIPMLGENRGA